MDKIDNIHEVLSAIERSERLLVSAHARPDGDAIGSILAMGMVLEQMGKQVDMVSCDRVPLIYRGLPCAPRIRQMCTVDGPYDAVILLECDGIERSRLEGLEGRFLINIDHHVSGRAFGHVNWIDHRACAVAEMVYDLALAAGARVTPEMATCLYTAVLTDTGSFCYAGTDMHTFELAGDLVRLGANPMTIAQNTYFAHPEAKMLLLGAALCNLRREGNIAWMWVTHEDMLRTKAVEEDCEGLVNYAIGIAGVEIAVFLRELPDRKVRLSIRSKGVLNVASVAEVFGGGGHHHASGCTLAGPLPVAEEQILACLQSRLRAQRQGVGDRV
ncbi:DHH family phosphoesterase [Silvibacterium dinghuense]|uniref:Bifunctional oligoribonuclease/PAP phosphatase NrnA n=1 Tax=Silvibacterium dinghuense TaxID=1560006 RepID=A0A4Q1SJA0_9BACT|nr:DHH family phosphoesterase [Silvibacterium dinghuense]RXS97340.1 bifunctional oligoribonuclease/PAP phosphatase NrnA [Silvibacterium dinghuense]GGG98191.1 phosphoesterase RecJ-like protein [Silvibacterium dinghuense]